MTVKLVSAFVPLLMLAAPLDTVWAGEAFVLSPLAWPRGSCPPPEAATALNAYQMYLSCDRIWREIGEGIRELAFEECLVEQKSRGVAEFDQQMTNCNEIYEILERE
ncbi:hypothetical protein [Devosia lacusdianchii]|uniref:hypothetical protein n=1 Tax=Devosia lacusdianchii TaxID=2917991 RepID=UPI001F0593B0|nr:hypothetical protein [Devosia sp. JXJ CY 41]